MRREPRLTGEHGAMSLELKVFRDRALVRQHVPFASVSELIRDDQVFVWVDALAPDTGELALLKDEFSLPELAVEDAIERGQRPKVDRYGDCRFTTAYAARLVAGRLQLDEIHIFASPRYAITVRAADTPELQHFLERLEQVPSDVPLGGGWAAYILLDDVVDTYFTVLERLADRIAELEDALLGEPAAALGGTALRDTYDTRRDLVSLRRVVAPLRDVLSVFSRRDEHPFGTDLDDYFRDLWDHVVTVFEEVDEGRDLLAAALEGHMSIVSNKLNVVMMKVSSWAAIIAVPTFIASLYGMNFVHMPELHWIFGYPLIVAVMAALALALYAFFRRRGWL